MFFFLTLFNVSTDEFVESLEKKAKKPLKMENTWGFYHFRCQYVTF